MVLLSKCVRCEKYTLTRKFNGLRYCLVCGKIVRQLSEAFGRAPQHYRGPSFLWDMSSEEIAAEIERFKGDE